MIHVEWKRDPLSFRPRRRSPMLSAFCHRQNARLARRFLLFPKISLRCDFREPCLLTKWRNLARKRIGRQTFLPCSERLSILYKIPRLTLGMTRPLLFSEILRLASLAQDDRRGYPLPHCPTPLFRRLRRHLPPRGKARPLLFQIILEKAKTALFAFSLYSGELHAGKVKAARVYQT